MNQMQHAVTTVLSQQIFMEHLLLENEGSKVNKAWSLSTKGF